MKLTFYWGREQNNATELSKLWDIFESCTAFEKKKIKATKEGAGRVGSSLQY
jgi:hypothetical protein